MKKNNSTNFITTPLLSEIETVLNNGISNILNDFSERYNLLEKTQSKILKLLKANKNLNYTSDIDNEEDSECNDNEGSSQSEEDIPMFVSIKDMTEEIVKHEISQYQKMMENKFNTFADNHYSMTLKLLDQIDNLKKELSNFYIFSEKNQQIQNSFKMLETSKMLETLKILETSKILETPTIVKVSELQEKENIILKLEEKELEFTTTHQPTNPINNDIV